MPTVLLILAADLPWVSEGFNETSAPFRMLAWRAGLLVVVVALVVFALRPRYDFVIALDRGRVTVRGRASPRLLAAAVDFFEQDFPPSARLTVLGRYRHGRPAELQFRGVGSPGERQRIRNYLMVYL